MPPDRDWVNALVILDDEAYRNTFAVTQRIPLKQNPNTTLAKQELFNAKLITTSYSTTARRLLY